jgi:hypothetical protein
MSVSIMYTTFIVVASFLKRVYIFILSCSSYKSSVHFMKLVSNTLLIFLSLGKLIKNNKLLTK